MFSSTYRNCRFFLTQTRRATSPAPKRRILETRHFPRYFHASVYFPTVTGRPLESSCAFTYWQQFIFLFIILVWEHCLRFLMLWFIFAVITAATDWEFQYSAPWADRNADLIERTCWGLLHLFLFQNKANPPYPTWYKCFCTVSVCEGKLRMSGEIGYRQKE